MTPDGYYDATVADAWLDVDDDGIVLCFRCQIFIEAEMTEVEPRHSCAGKYGWSGEAVAEFFGLEFPAGLRKITETVGKECRINIKTKTARDGNEYQNAYIVTRQRKEPATQEAINAALAKLEAAASDDDAPF